MLPVRLLGSSLLLLLLAPACAAVDGSSDDDEDSVEQGESDIVGTKKGNAIGSRFAKPDASYFPARTIATLEAVGALDANTRAALKRADGIIAAEPSDGKVTIAELLRLESPEFERVLLPNERAGRERAWRMLEAPKNAPPAYLPKAGDFAPVKTVVRETGKLDRNKSLPLSSVSSDVALVRVEQAYDVDGKKTTIAIADCDAALASPAPFTPAEIEAIRAARATIARQLSVSGTARIEVESPKEQTKALATIAGVRIRQVRKTSYVETRTLGQGREGLTSASLVAFRSSVARFDQIPADAKLVVVQMTPTVSGPNAFSVGDSVVPITATDPETAALIPGAYDWSGPEAVVEIWRGGVRRSAIALATLWEEGAVSLDDYVDFDIVASNKSLVKNAISADATHKTITFALQGTPAAPAGGVTAADLQATATPPLDLTKFPVGQYVDPSGRFDDRIDIITDKVVFHRTKSVSAIPFSPVIEEFYRMRPTSFYFAEQHRAAFRDVAPRQLTLLQANGMLLIDHAGYLTPPFNLDGANRQ